MGAQLGVLGAVDLGGDEVGAHVFCGGEVAAPAGFDDGDGQSDREVGLAAAGLAQQQDRPVLFDEVQGGEVCDEFGVD